MKKNFLSANLTKAAFVIATVIYYLTGILRLQRKGRAKSREPNRTQGPGDD